MRTSIVVCGCLLLLLAVAASGKEEVDSSLENGSFEAVVAARPTRDTGQGAWTFGADEPDARRVVAERRVSRHADGRGRGGRGGGALHPGRRRAPSATRSSTGPAPRCGPGAGTASRPVSETASASVLVYEYRKRRRRQGAHPRQRVGPGRHVAAGRRLLRARPRRTSRARPSRCSCRRAPRPCWTTSSSRRWRARPPARRRAPSASRTRRSSCGSRAWAASSPSSRRRTEKDHADPSAPTPVLSAVRDGVRIPVASLTKRGSTLTARFADPAVVAKIRVQDARPLLPLRGRGREARRPRGARAALPGASRCGVRDAWMPGTYDDAFGICQMGVTANTEVAPRALRRVGGAGEPAGTRRHGIEGGRSVLIATGADRFLDTIRRMERRHRAAVADAALGRAGRDRHHRTGRGSPRRSAAATSSPPTWGRTTSTRSSATRRSAASA